MQQKSLRAVWQITLILLLGGLAQAPAAQLGARPAADRVQRLDDPKRVASLKIDEVLATIKLKPGNVVADIGAGSGIFSRPMARAVGPKGKVFAVEVDKDLVAHINERSKQEKIKNLEAVLGEFDDPKLPARNVDVAFFQDVIHHIEHRQTYLKNLATYLKPDARIVMIDFVMDKNNPKSPHAESPEMQITKEDVTGWMATVGFRPVEESHLFSDKYFVIYAR